ncbi:MAG: low molecular weight protein-tyrosine-phosphatase [Pseudomonadota bacterium]
MKKVLCVCLGNICRSPAAEGILRASAEKRKIPILVDSAGTGGWHVGRPPDARMVQAASRRGYDLTTQRARQVALSDFYEFDYVLAMDESNLADLQDMAPPNSETALHLFLAFSEVTQRETPDPYYGGASGFEHVLDLVEQGAAGFLDFLEDR